MATPNLAKITLTIDEFKNNPSTFPCEPYCSLVDPPNGIVVADGAPNGSGKKQVGLDPADPTVIWMQSKNAAGGQAGPVDVEFTIAAKDASNTYTATGSFQFVQNSGNHDPVGGQNFKKVSVTGGKLRLRNAWKHQGHVNAPATCPRWELFIQVQDQNGMLGWIDPAMENADDM